MMKIAISLTGRVCAALVLIVLRSRAGFAQAPADAGTSARWFVSGGFSVDDDHTHPDSTPTIVGVTSVGVDLGRHVGVRLLLDVPTLDGAYPAERRRTSWSALFDRHGQVTDRVRVGFVTGFTEERPSWWGVTFGTEVAAATTKHLTVVPEARILLFPGAEYGRTWIFRAGVSVRWRS